MLCYLNSFLISFYIIGDNHSTQIHVSYICFVTKHINHLFAGQKQLLGMWITKNGKNHSTIYM